MGYIEKLPLSLPREYCRYRTTSKGEVWKVLPVVVW